MLQADSGIAAGPAAFVGDKIVDKLRVSKGFKKICRPASGDRLTGIFRRLVQVTG